MSVYVYVLSPFSLVQLFATPWTAAHQAPLSVGFSRREYWSGSPCPPLGDLPDPEIKPESLMFTALAGRFFTTSATWEANMVGHFTDDTSIVAFMHILTVTKCKLYKVNRIQILSTEIGEHTG